MGGTFDPIHNGHLVCAEEARLQFSLDEVFFVPSGRPWQKRDVSPAEDRYLLTMIATSSNCHFSVYGDDVELFFITGTDAVAEILTWKDPEAVLDEAHFIAANRPSYSLSDEHRKLFRDRVSVMEIPALAISSTDIRRRVAEGRTIRYLLPREVREFIEERNLYRPQG
jgi:nicotinate-nucleotide adenylyltransferase